jgi:hypothetical protein
LDGYTLVLAICFDVVDGNAPLALIDSIFQQENVGFCGHDRFAEIDSPGTIDHVSSEMSFERQSE